MKINESHKRGFSLLELLVVLLITLILTLVAVGSYASFQKSRRIRGAAEAVNSTLVAARSYAITTNGFYRVVFQLRNPTTGAQEFAMWVDEVESAEATDETNLNRVYALPPTAKRPKVTTPNYLQPGMLISRIVVSGNTYTSASGNFVVLYFKPEGSSDDATINLINEAADSTVSTNYYSVKLYPATAKSTIYPRELR